MELLQELLSQFNLGKESIWISQVFIIVFATLVLSFFQKRVFQKLNKKLIETKNPWDDLLIGAAAGPVSYLIWLLGILFAAKLFSRKVRPPYSLLLTRCVMWVLLVY